MAATEAGFEEHIVVDADNFTVGHVAQAEKDPRSHGVRALVVRLSEEARARMGRDAGPHVVIPMDYVAGIRRGELDLDRSFDSMRSLLEGPPRPPVEPPRP